MRISVHALRIVIMNKIINVITVSFLLSRVGGIFGCFASICFAGVGFTPSDLYFDLHVFFANWVFRSMSLAVFFYSLTFLFQSMLVVGIPLIGLPLLIHLINLRRHQRVQWAAMEFLLESQKRNKKWILLRQLFLLLLRVVGKLALFALVCNGIVLHAGEHARTGPSS